MIELKDMPLMEEKVDYVKNNAHKLFHEMSFIRRYFKIYQNTGITNSFFRIGYKNIIDKEFFVKDFNDIYYDYKSLPRNYAKGVSQGEINYVLNTIEKDEIVKSSEMIINSKDDLIDLFYPGSEDILFANPIYFSDFWEIGKMKWKEGRPTYFYWINEAPIYFSPQISKNKFIHCNPEAIEVYIKEDFRINISLISKSERENILMRNPQYQSENLDEKVLIEVYELIKCKINTDYRVDQILLDGDYIKSKLS
jgi:hypothetical protein